MRERKWMLGKTIIVFVLLLAILSGLIAVDHKLITFQQKNAYPFLQTIHNIFTGMWVVLLGCILCVGVSVVEQIKKYRIVLKRKQTLDVRKTTTHQVAEMILNVYLQQGWSGVINSSGDGPDAVLSRKMDKLMVWTRFWRIDVSAEHRQQIVSYGQHHIAKSMLITLRPISDEFALWAMNNNVELISYEQLVLWKKSIFEK